MASVDTAAATHALKVVIGKRLNHGANLFLFDEPMVGLDVGTEASIRRLLASLLAKGADTIIISSYLRARRALRVSGRQDCREPWKQGLVPGNNTHRGRSALGRKESKGND